MDSAPPNPTEARWLRLTGGLVVAAALAVIAGWVTNREGLVRWTPGGSFMVVNTAVCALVSGAGLLALTGGRWRVATACGAAVALFAAAVFTNIVLGLPLALDELFWRHQWSEPPFPAGQMAPNTAVAFALVGAALVLQTRQRTGRWLLPIMGGVVAALALVPLLSYLILALSRGGTLVYRGMSLPTAASGWSAR